MIGAPLKAIPYEFGEEAAPSLTKAGESLVRLAGVGAWSALLVFAAYLLAQLLGGALVGLVAGAAVGLSGFDLHEPTSLWHFTPVMVSAAAVIGMLCATIVVVRLARYFESRSPSTAFPHDLGWKPVAFPELQAGLAAGALLGVAYLWAVAQLQPPGRGGDPGPLAQMAGTPGLPQFAWVFLVLVVAPPLEEFLFRGVLFTGFERSWGRLAACFIVTTLFVVVHLPGTGLYWPALTALALVGIGTMVARLRTGSVFPGVALHAAYNLTIVMHLVLFKWT